MEALADGMLVELAQKGNKKAFATLLERHYQPIYNLAFRWCRIQQDAEEIAQEVCIKLVKALINYRGEAAFSSWLYGITLNTARDFQRKKRGRDKREQVAENLDQFQTNEENPEQALISSLIRRCIALLPDTLRMAVLLVHGQGLNHKQAGNAQQCAEGTISWRLSEARKQLSKCLNRGDLS